jgi:hypothetical protein
VRTFVTQSRIASLMASLSVLDPDSTATTSAPSSRIRSTFNRWRRMSSEPMYTTHSSPSSAHAVAVATPCCPAPVSAMTRFFPISQVSSAWPRALLILCAPVWHRSSRLSQIRAPPRVDDSRFASYSGVGRPTNRSSKACRRFWNRLSRDAAA